MDDYGDREHDRAGQGEGCRDRDVQREQTSVGTSGHVPVARRWAQRARRMRRTVIGQRPP